MTATVTPARLAFARARAGVPRTTLAKRSEVSARALAYYEEGTREPTQEVLERLARELDVPVDFFFASEIDELPEEAASFRALSKMTAGRRDAALASGALAIELNRWLESHLRLPAPDVPHYERVVGDAATAAQRLRFEWEMGYSRIANVVHLLEAHGVRVFSLPENLADVDAFSFWWESTPYILLNTRKSHERGRFDAAHELAHLVIHSDYDMPRGREKEAEANRFAAAFLMPESDVLASGLNNAGVEAVIAARHRWGVAAMALTHRLHELGMTSDWTYAATCRRLSQMGYRGSEPGGQLGRETSQLLEKAFLALRERGVRLPDVARELSLHSGALRELMFGLVLTPIDGGAVSSGAPRPRLQLVDPTS